MTHEVSQGELQRWLREARRGSSPAALSLWERVSPRMLSLAKEMAGASVAGDIVQGVFLAILQMPEKQAKGVQDVAAYLIVATRNACLNAIRSRVRRESAVDGCAREAVDGVREQRDTAIADGVHGVNGLHGAMSRLADEHREVVLLKHVGGLTFDQMSLCLDEKRGTLASRYKRALEELQGLMGAGDDRPAARVREEVRR